MANQESRRLFRSYFKDNKQMGRQQSSGIQNCALISNFELDMPFMDLTTSNQGDKFDIMKKRIFRSFSFQQARDGEDQDNCGDDPNDSYGCNDNCVNLMTIINHIDEAECFELMLEQQDSDNSPLYKSEDI